MLDPLQDRYINLLTDFGFKRVFGTEPNKRLLIDFLNTLLPQQHHIQDVSFKNNENIGNTQIDRKAVFDIYCQIESGERFIVEIQKAKQNFFKDRSVYYSTFPIQEQALKGDWDYELSAVYTKGIEGGKKCPAANSERFARLADRCCDRSSHRIIDPGDSSTTCRTTFVISRDFS